MLMFLILSPDSFSLSVSHTGTTYSVSHFFIYTLPLSHLDIFRSFHSAVRAHFDLLSRDPFYIMASQDLISQYSADMNGIPPSQPDRSRTPPRHQHGWHQAVPAFRGPMHYAMTTHRPFWNPSGIPPPPPTLHRSQHAHHGLHLRHLFRLHRLRAHRHLPTMPILHLNAILSHRDRRDLCHPREQVPRSTKDIHADQLKSHQWRTGNLMSTSTTPTRSMVWTFPPEFDKADSQATRTLKGWILYKSHSGSSCTRACTIPGFVGLHTEEKPSFFLLTT